MNGSFRDTFRIGRVLKPHYTFNLSEWNPTKNGSISAPNYLPAEERNSFPTEGYHKNKKIKLSNYEK